MWTDDVELTLVELDEVLFGRIAKYEFAHAPEYIHLELLFRATFFLVVPPVVYERGGMYE